MKKKVIISSLFTFILLLILVKLLSNHIINESFIENYYQEIYYEHKVKKLLVLNIFEPYVAHYNYGNLLYQTDLYDLAIEEYEKALKTTPKEKRCNVIINISLSKVEIALKEKDFEARKTKLKEAREVLYEEECAVEGESKDGKSKDAETLEDEIKKLEEQKPEEKESNNPEEQQEQEENDKIEAEIKDRNQKSAEQRKEEEKDRENANNYTYYDGDRW